MSTSANPSRSSRSLGVIAFALLIGLGAFTFRAFHYQAFADEAEPVYVFAFFRDSGASGLYLAASRDGLHWEDLNQGQPLMRSDIGGGLMRDPSVTRGPDGRFHMVWTSGWEDRGIGIAHSSDLVNWQSIREVPVMKHETTARNAWAPEIFWDAASERFWIYWASTLPEKFTETAEQADAGWNHRIYATTTRDFRAFSQTELFLEPGFNVIDAHIQGDGDAYVMVLKDETRYPPAKNLMLARASALSGPWEVDMRVISPESVWVEGPALLRADTEWLLYFDRYLDKQFGALRSSDLQHWEDVSEQLHMPEGARHGSVIKLDAIEWRRLQTALQALAAADTLSSASF